MSSVGIIYKAPAREPKSVVKIKNKTGFPGGSVVKNPSANAGETGLITDLEATAMTSPYSAKKSSSHWTQPEKKPISKEDPEQPKINK